MTTMRNRAVVSHADAMSDQIPDPEVPKRAKRARSYSARYKAEILAEYETLDREGKGALLRREGLYTSLLSEWRKQRDRGVLQALARPSGRPPVAIIDAKPQFRRLQAGRTLVEQGQRGDELFLLFDGVLRVEIDGRPVAEVGPGAIVGEMALLHQGRRMATLRAVTPCRVAVGHCCI